VEGGHCCNCSCPTIHCQQRQGSWCHAVPSVGEAAVHSSWPHELKRSGRMTYTMCPVDQEMRRKLEAQCVRVEEKSGRGTRAQ
jgi:hypothetical protein